MGLGVLALLAACSSGPRIPGNAERLAKLDQTLSQTGWKSIELTGDRFNLVAALGPPVSPTDVLTIYIEGDGLSWIGSQRVSTDPTPIDPYALKLAVQDKRPAAWLARPCQYVLGSGCSAAAWTSHRYSPEAIAAIDHAVSVLKQSVGASSVALVGFSGGGVAAALVAAQRTDVRGLATVASNLDTELWTRVLGLAPLVEGSNPARVAHKLSGLPQIHFAGEDDHIVPARVTRSFVTAAKLSQSNLYLMPSFDHNCCWITAWPSLSQKLPW